MYPKGIPFFKDILIKFIKMMPWFQWFLQPGSTLQEDRIPSNTNGSSTNQSAVAVRASPGLRDHDY